MKLLHLFTTIIFNHCLIFIGTSIPPPTIDLLKSGLDKKRNNISCYDCTSCTTTTNDLLINCQAEVYTPEYYYPLPYPFNSSKDKDGKPWNLFHGCIDPQQGPYTEISEIKSDFDCNDDNNNDESVACQQLIHLESNNHTFVHKVGCSDPPIHFQTNLEGGPAREVGYHYIPVCTITLHENQSIDLGCSTKFIKNVNITESSIQGKCFEPESKNFATCYCDTDKCNGYETENTNKKGDTVNEENDGVISAISLKIFIYVLPFAIYLLS